MQKMMQHVKIKDRINVRRNIDEFSREESG